MVVSVFITMNVLAIINEVIEIFEQDYHRDLQRQTMLRAKSPEMGNYVGKIVEEDDYYGTKGHVLSKIYMNPTNLQNFEANVRAISDEKGNLYVAQFDENFYHDRMKAIVTPRLYVSTFIHWYRIGETPVFRVANSYLGYYRIPNRELEADCLNKVVEKQPYEFRFDIENQ